VTEFQGWIIVAFAGLAAAAAWARVLVAFLEYRRRPAGSSLTGLERTRP
jgi:hypothetical protein